MFYRFRLKFSAICQKFFDKKRGILIKEESETMINQGLKITRDYI